MVLLNKLLGTILRDMAAAQHEANLYALKLSAAYRGLNAAAVPDLPAVCLGETELTLHCGFSDESATGETVEIDETAVRNALRDIVPSIAETVISSILSTIVRHTGDTGQDEGPVARLDREKGLRHDFTVFLGEQIDRCLTGRQTEFITDDGRFDLIRLQAIILAVTDEHFLSHSEIAYLFADGSATGLRNAIFDNLKADLKIMLPRLLKNTTVTHTETFSDIEVVANTDALAELPATCIQTLRLKIRPRNLPADTEP